MGKVTRNEEVVIDARESQSAINNVSVNGKSMDLSLFPTPRNHTKKAKNDQDTSFQFPEVHLRNLQNRLNHEADASMLIGQDLGSGNAVDDSWILNASSWTSKQRQEEESDNDQTGEDDNGNADALHIRNSIEELEASIMANLQNGNGDSNNTYG